MVRQSGSNEVAYLDDVVSHSGSSDYVVNIRAFFERLHPYHLKISPPSKAQIGATQQDFLVPTILPRRSVSVRTPTKL